MHNFDRRFYGFYDPKMQQCNDLRPKKITSLENNKNLLWTCSSAAANETCLRHTLVSFLRHATHILSPCDNRTWNRTAKNMWYCHRRIRQETTGRSNESFRQTSKPLPVSIIDWMAKSTTRGEARQISLFSATRWHLRLFFPRAVVLSRCDFCCLWKRERQQQQPALIFCRQSPSVAARTHTHTGTQKLLV